MDIVEIVHNITYQVQDKELEKAVRTVKGNMQGIENLTKRQIALANRYNQTATQDEKTRERISRLIKQNANNVNFHSKSLENNLLNNKALNRAMEKELGLIGAIEKKLQILKRSRNSATSLQDVQRYNGLIAQQQTRLNSTRQVPAPRPTTGGTSGGGIGGLISGGGAIGRLLPAIGGALAIGNLAGQIKDVTQRFESYRTTLRNTFQSSTKANQEFDKIKKFAEQTPFSVDELTSSFIKLVNRGFNPTKEELTSIGDLAASQGKSFDQLTEAILDGQTGEFERLKEFGIKAKTAGDTVTLSFKGVEKQVKKTDEGALRNAIISFGQLAGVAGGMSAQSATLGGKISNLGDSFDSLFSNIGSKGLGSFGAFIDIVKEAVDWMNEFIAVSPVDALIEEQAELNNLVSQLILVNDQQELRNGVMAEISAKYPEFLSFIDTEKTSVEGLALAMSILNKEYDNKIRLAGLEEESKLNTEKKTELFKKQREALQKLIPALKEYGITEIQFAKLSPAKQRETAERALKKLGDAKSNEAVNEISTSTREFAGGKKLNQANAIYKAKNDFDAFFAANDQLTKNAVRLSELTSAYTESGINELKETLAEQEKQLALLQKQEGNADKIVETQKIIAGLKLKLNPDSLAIKPKDTATTSKGKQKTASEIALEKIDEEQKTEQAKLKKANEERLAILKDALQKELITQDYYDHVLQEYTDTNNIALLEIENKYNEKRLSFQKTAEKEVTEAKIAEIKNSVTDLQQALKNRSEALLKQVLEDAKQLDEALLNQLATAQAREEKAINDKFDKLKTNRGNGTLQSLNLANSDLIGAEESQNPDRIKSATARIDALKDILKKERDLTLAEETQRQSDLLEIKNKYFEIGISEQQKSVENALNKYTEAEQKRFDTLFTGKDDNSSKLESLRNSNAEIINEEDLSNRKRLKLEEERAKRSEEIATRSALANQFAIKDGLEQTIKEYQSQLSKIETGDLSVTKSVQDDIENKLAESLAKLGLTQAQIEELFGKVAKSSKDGISQTTQDAFALGDAMLSAASTIASALEGIADKEIEVRENRVDKAKEIAERGNAEALQIEEERLRNAQAQKEKYARLQMAVNLAQQASALALAIAQAAAIPFPANIPAIVSVISAVGAGISTVMQLTASQPQGFKEGVVGLNGAGTETSDSISARLSKGESVITANGTKIGDNAEILKAMNNNVAFSSEPLNFKSPNALMINGDNKKLESKLDGVIKSVQEVSQAVQNIKGARLSFDREGIHAVASEIDVRDRKRGRL